MMIEIAGEHLAQAIAAGDGIGLARVVTQGLMAGQPALEGGRALADPGPDLKPSR
jgi:hypothetical protein